MGRPLRTAGDQTSSRWTPSGSRRSGLDSWFQSEKARDAQLAEDSAPDAGDGDPGASAPESDARPDTGRSRLSKSIRVGLVAAVLAVAVLLTYPAFRKAAARISPLTTPGRLQGGAHGKAESGTMVRLEVGPAGGPRARVSVRNGEMVRIETASARFGLHTARRDDRLEGRAFHLAAE